MTSKVSIETTIKSATEVREFVNKLSNALKDGATPGAVISIALSKNGPVLELHSNTFGFPQRPAGVNGNYDKNEVDAWLVSIAVWARSIITIMEKL